MNKKKNRSEGVYQPSNNPKRIIREQKIEVFQGQFPHPEIMNGYPDDVRKIILEMAQKEQENSFLIKKEEIDVLNRYTNKNIKLESRGQIFGFLLAILDVLGVFFLAYFGKTGAWITTLIIGFVSMVTVFIKNNTNNANHKK